MTPMLINQAMAQAEQFMCVIVKNTLPATVASVSVNTTFGSNVIENGGNNEVLGCNR